MKEVAVYGLPLFLVQKHVVYSLELLAEDAGWPPLERDEEAAQAAISNAIVSSTRYGEREDVCWALAWVLEAPSEVTAVQWASLAGGTHPEIFDEPEGPALFRRTLAAFLDGRSCGDVARLVRVVDADHAAWREAVGPFPTEIPHELVEFHLDDSLLDNPDSAHVHFGVEPTERTLSILSRRPGEYGERLVVQCIVDHLISAPRETLALFARPGRRVPDPEQFRELLRRARRFVWGDVPAAPPITLTPGSSILEWRAERHRRARLAAGLPW